MSESNYENLPRLRSDVQKSIEEQKREKIREILGQTIETRIRTSFIFALAEMERLFGYLWGHDVEDKNQLTANQLEFLQRYRQLRKSVLDNGNSQIRVMSDELQKFDISWVQRTLFRKE